MLSVLQQVTFDSFQLRFQLSWFAPIAWPLPGLGLTRGLDRIRISLTFVGSKPPSQNWTADSTYCANFGTSDTPKPSQEILSISGHWYLSLRSVCWKLSCLAQDEPILGTISVCTRDWDDGGKLSDLTVRRGKMKPTTWLCELWYLVLSRLTIQKANLRHTMQWD